MFTESPELVPSGIILRYTRDVYGFTRVSSELVFYATLVTCTNSSEVVPITGI